MKTKIFFKKFLRCNKSENNNENSAELAKKPTTTENALKKAEKKILTNLLAIQELSVDSIMIPRTDVSAIPIDIDKNDVIKELANNQHSRWPVYNEKLDDIRGFIHVRDVAKSISYDDFDCRQIIQPIIFIPASITIIDLLTEMHQKQTPIAIVVDEYGGTDGLVTAWNILQKILGENTPDEEESHAKLLREDDGSFLADARVSIEELEKALEISLIDDEQRDEIDTISGLILSITGRVPNRKEIIEHEKGYEFEIIKSTPRHIVTVRITKKHDPSKNKK